MKVLSWTSRFPPDVGGIETLCRSLNRRFASAGISVEVLTGPGPLTEVGTTIVDGIPVHRIDLRGAVKTGDVVRVARARAEVARVKTAFEPDVVHLHVSGPEPAFHLMTQTDPPTPTVVTSHGHEPALFGIGRGAMMRSVFSAASCVTTVSPAGFRAIVSMMPEVQDRAVLVENGVDVPAHAVPIPGGPPVAAMIGRLVPQKLPCVAIEAMAHLKETEPDLQLVVAGHGIDGPRVQALAEELGVTDSVQFTGPLDGGQVDALIRRSTMLVIPSAFEGLPMAVLEAAAIGRPIVGTNIDGLDRLIREGVTGHRVPVNSPGALAGAMAKIAGDRGHAATLGQAAHAMARDEFSMRSCAQSYIDIYHRIVGDSHA